MEINNNNYVSQLTLNLPIFKKLKLKKQLYVHS